MSTRTTKEVITPGGKKIVLYDYLTGGESRHIQATYMENFTAGDLLGLKEEKAKEMIMQKVPASVVYKAQELTLQMLIVSVDGGVKEKAYQDAMDLPPADLDFLMKVVDEYTSSTIAKKN